MPFLLKFYIQTVSFFLIFFSYYIQALGAAIQYGTATPINDCLPGLAQRLCDTNPSVRLTSVRIIGNWLLELPDR